jgi:phosphatidylserine/phosphatidylglycerophosphate/cardiolipin synthase-like enzyme
MLRAVLLSLALMAAAGVQPAAAGEAPPGQSRLFAATGTVQVAFTPGDPVDEILIGVIGQARQQVLVKAFSFTHKRIARALVDAHRRGVRVEVLADARQDRQLEGSVLTYLARNGIPVWLDAKRASAHNKVMVIDAGTPAAVALAGAFVDNWQRLRAAARPYRARAAR